MTGAVTGAERQRRYRERRRAELIASMELQEQGRAEARQAGLPLAPVGEPDDAPPEPVMTGGRPAGSVARKTAEWQQYILTRYRSPLVGLAEIAARPARDLAEELGCTALEAFDRQLKALAELAPYVHSKMPAAVQHEGAPTVPIYLGVSPAMAARMGVEVGAAESETIQGLDGEATR